MMISDLSGFHPEEGVDRKLLKRIKKRFLDLNQIRLERTCEAIGERQASFIDLLPLLFHTNHPMLPGFTGSHTPAGIAQFSPNQRQLSAARIVARSFDYKNNPAAATAEIDGLFLMGSVGTIAHSDSSDLDIWVCHPPSLGSEERQNLEQKCHLISRWADSHLGLEAHFFLMAPNGGITENLAPMNTESSGSAQYHLLLDEFYRSAIWLAGKTPLWWWVPHQYETDYSLFTEQMLKKRFIRHQDIIDFGPITHIPKSEFLGAGIWQLYKGIDAPHKSLLKLLLLESYALSVDAEPLALAHKRQIYQAEPDPDYLDAYVQIYFRIENYLQSTKQTERLDIARHCFYFKVDKRLTHAPSSGYISWQRALLKQLVRNWGWSDAQLSHLDRRRLWKAPQVQKERDRLVAELSKCYRLLGNINRDALQAAAISGRELSILGRKLHAAYERKSGKIEQLNPGISGDLSEAFLTAEAHTDSYTEHWTLYRCRAHQLGTPTNRQQYFLKEAHSLLELLVWAYCNKIMTRITQLSVMRGGMQIELREHELLATISQWLPLTEQSAPHERFIEPAYALRQLMIVNLGELPYPELHEKGLEKISSQSDALNYSGFKDNLVKRIDIATINSWHEIVIRSFSQHPLTEAVLYYLRQTAPSAQSKPPAIVIRCLSAQLAHIVTARLDELWSDIGACYYSGTRPATTRYLFNAGECFYVIQHQQDIPSLHQIKSYPDLIEHLGKPQHYWSPINIDRHCLQDQTLSIICANIHTPGTYLFYELLDEKIVYTLVDPEGALWQKALDQQTNRAFLSPMLGFIRVALERLYADTASSPYNNLRSSSIYCYEVAHSEAGKPYVISHNERDLVSSHQFIDIKVIAEPDGNQIRYKIYCNEELLLSKHGGPIQQAAQAIAKKRQGKSAYHCYISDLDLTACSNLIAPETGLRLVHYIKEKEKIEAQLNFSIKP